MRNPPGSFLAASALLLLGLAGSTARAHEVGLSRGTWVQADGGAAPRVQTELVFARAEALSLCPAVDSDADRKLTEGEVKAAGEALSLCLLADIEVESDGLRCPPAFEGADLTEEDGFAVRASFACPRPGRTTVDLGRLLSRTAPGHRHLGRVATAAAENDVIALSSSPAFSFGVAQQRPPVSAYLLIGVEHIAFGWDHLVFLLGLVLVGGRLRSLIAVVTAFTLAHSVSLALAVLGIVVPSGAVIEPLIALSIAYVGVENFFVDNAEKRWRITAPFGLIHGFGFAGALAEVGVPADAVAPALFLFNLGVELGQLAVLALVLPVLAVLQRRAPAVFGRVKQALSVAVVVLGTWWFIERVFLS